MPIAFQCPKCGGQFAAPDTLAGKKARCQRCSTVVDVPLAPKPQPKLVPIGMAQPESPQAMASASVAAAPARQPATQPVARQVAQPAAQPSARPAAQPHPQPGAYQPQAAIPDPFASAHLLRPVAMPRRSIPWGWIVGGVAALMVVGLLVGGGLVAMAVWRKLSEIDVERLVAQNADAAIEAGSSQSSLDDDGESSNGNDAQNSHNSSQGSGSSSPWSDSPPVVPNMPVSRGNPSPPAEDLPVESSLPPSDWSAAPDPPSTTVEYKKGKISVALHESAELFLPDGPSHFILVRVHDFRKEGWQVLDLRTGTGIGKSILTKLEFNHDTEVFSADGRYLAAVQWGKHDETPVPVWSFATGDLAKVLVLNGRVTGPLRFGGPHELITLHDPDHETSLLTVWNVQTGEKLREISFPQRGASFEDRLRPESLAVSPGGKYAALLMGKQLGVVNLKTGEAAGRVPLAVNPSSVEAVAFSPDGAELAILVTHGIGHRLMMVDFATGRLTLDHDYRGRLDHYWYDGPLLDWLPDKTGLVYAGHVLLERTTGQDVWVFPRTDSSPRRIIRDGEILLVMRGRGGKALQSADLDERQIARAMEAVRGGGAAIDAALPALTTADLFSATAATLPSGAVAWAVTADAAGSPLRITDRDILVAADGETLQRVAFAGPAAAKLVVQKEVTPKGVAGRRQSRQVVVERFDLGTGEKGAAVELPHVYQLADVSPSGKFILVAFAQDNRYERLDVVGIAPKKHIAAWRPFSNESPAAEGDKSRRPGIWGQTTDPRGVVWGSMIDDDHVLTVNSAGKLVCWTLPDCKAAYYFDDFGTPFALSGGRKYLAGVHHGEFRVFDARTGACVGELEAPLLGARPLRGAFRPDGRELVAINDAGADKMLVRWDLETGKLEQEIPLPSAIVQEFSPFFAAHNGARLGLEYRGPKHLMLDDQYLIDLEKRAVIWKYHLPSGTYAANTPDDKTWYCIRKPGPGTSGTFLTSIETPSASVRSKSAEISLEKQLVLYPGMRVRTVIDLSGVGKDALRDTVQKGIEQGLESRGLIIDPAAKHVFSVTASQRSTGESVGVYSGHSPFHHSPFGRRSSPQQSINLQEMVCRMAVTDSGGKELWKLERVVRMRGFGSVGDNAEQQLQTEMAQSFESLLASSGSATESMPRYVFAALDTLLAGESQLGYHTESPPPAPVRPGASSAGSSGPMY